MGKRKKIHCFTKRSDASIILHVLIATTVAGLLLFSWWRQNSLLYEIVVAREQSYQHRYMTDLLLSYGIKLIKERGLESLKLDCSFIARLLGKDFGATISFVDSVLYATLYKDGKKICGVSCTVP